MMPAPNCGDWSAIGYICDLIAAASCTASRSVLNQRDENFVDNKIKTCLKYNGVVKVACLAPLTQPPSALIATYETDR